MFVVLSGYCEVSRDAGGGGGGGAAASRRTTAAALGASTPTPAGCDAPPAPSRRFTLELQRAELLRGLAAGGQLRESVAAAASCEGAATAAASDEPPCVDGPASAPESPRPPAPAAVTWLCEGDSFGEAALLDPARRRGCTVTAGDGGAQLATVDAAALRQLAAGAPHAAQAVAAAACRRALAAPPGQRPEEDIEALALLFGELQVIGASRPGMEQACRPPSSCRVHSAAVHGLTGPSSPRGRPQPGPLPPCPLPGARPSARVPAPPPRARLRGAVRARRRRCLPPGRAGRRHVCGAAGLVRGALPAPAA